MREAGVIDEGQARRLHPGTIGISLLKNAPSTLIGLPAFLAFTSRGGWAWIIPVVIVATLVSALFTWLGWLRFTYRIMSDDVVIESGLLSRKRRSIPFDRIQDVSIERGPLARLFGLARVRLETGGGGDDEGDLDSVSMAEAQRLRATLRGERVTRMAMEGAEPEPVAAAEPIFAMSFGRVLFSGLFNFSLVWLAALFGALQYLDDFLGFSYRDLVRWAGLARDTVSDRVTFANIALLLIAAAFLGIFSGVLRTIARDFGFKLTHEQARFRRVRGLFTHSEVVVAERRIQLALVHTGWLRRLFGYQGVSFQTLGGSDDASGRQEMAPFADPREVLRVLNAAKIAAPDRAGLTQVSRGHVTRALIKNGAVPLIVIAGAGFAFPPAWLALLLMPVPLGIALLERRFHRYRLEAGRIVVARGVTAQRTWIVPTANVQAVSVTQGWLQRRLGLASVMIDTAGGSVLSGPHVIDVKRDEAWGLQRGLVERVA